MAMVFFQFAFVFEKFGRVDVSVEEVDNTNREVHASVMLCEQRRARKA